LHAFFFPMAQFAGDTADITRETIHFCCIHELKGDKGHGSFSIADNKGFQAIAACRGVVQIVDDSLTCQVIGPPAADKATAVHVAIVPTLTSYPTKPSEVASIGGSAYCEHSIYAGSRTATIAFAAEAAHQIKPTPVVGRPPVVCFYFNIVGADTTTVALLKVSGTVRVTGTGFVKTW
jgi:hypothetical protein